jgi:carbamoyl-phosphate synthase small subunit
LPQKTPAVLVLADGSVFRGCGIGADGQTVGEVVFNTAMTGYQEILTDPSYAGQIVTLTYPHIGNVGTNGEDAESRSVYAAGLIIRDLPLESSSWRQEEDLSTYLRRNALVAIGDIDTRGSRACCAARARRTAASSQGRSTRRRPWPPPARRRPWRPGSRQGGEREGGLRLERQPLGARHRLQGRRRGALPRRRVRLRREAQHPAQPQRARLQGDGAPGDGDREGRARPRPDGVFLSNGPGDPEPCDYAIKAIREILGTGTPVFGICLGHQLLGLAAGAKTVKMKFGHHGANHPVQELDSGRVFITSQNHGFAVDEKSLPANVRATHRSLFDGSLQASSSPTSRPTASRAIPRRAPGRARWSTSSTSS